MSGGAFGATPQCFGLPSTGTKNYYPNGAKADQAPTLQLDHSRGADKARVAALEGYGPERYAAHSRACAIRPDRTALLRDSAVPRLVVAADTDLVIPTEKQKAMADQLGADFAQVAQAGHMLPAEQPEALAEAVSGWMLSRGAA